MNKALILSVVAVLALSSCGTYAGEGAYAGASLGSILGSAIGGISGGWRGSDVGTIIGMAGGAVIGAAVGSAADQKQQQEYQENQRERNAPYTRNYQRSGTRSADDGSGFDPTHSGDDRIIMEPDNKASKGSDNVYTTVTPKTISVNQLQGFSSGSRLNYNDAIELRNLSFVDRNGNGIISAGEECKLSFDIMNNSDVTLYDIMPTVVELTGNKRIHISQGIRIESIQPRKGVRYTATVYGDSRLKDGEAVIRVAIAQGNNDITSQVKEFVIQTSKK